MCAFLAAESLHVSNGLSPLRDWRLVYAKAEGKAAVIYKFYLKRENSILNLGL